LAVRRRNDVGAGCCYLVAAERAAPVLYLISAPGPLRPAWHAHVLRDLDALSPNLAVKKVAWLEKNH